MNRKEIHFNEIRNYLKVAHAARVDQLSTYLSHFNKGMNGKDVYEIVTSVYGDWEKDWKDKPLDEMVELLRIYDSRIEPMNSLEYDTWAENTISFLRSWIFCDVRYIKYIVCG